MCAQAGALCRDTAKHHPWEAPSLHAQCQDAHVQSKQTCSLFLLIWSWFTTLYYFCCVLPVFTPSHVWVYDVVMMLPGSPPQPSPGHHYAHLNLISRVLSSDAPKTMKYCAVSRLNLSQLPRCETRGRLQSYVIPRFKIDWLWNTGVIRLRWIDKPVSYRQYSSGKRVFLISPVGNPSPPVRFPFNMRTQGLSCAGPSRAL